MKYWHYTHILTSIEVFGTTSLGISFSSILFTVLFGVVPAATAMPASSEHGWLLVGLLPEVILLLDERRNKAFALLIIEDIFDDDWEYNLKVVDNDNIVVIKFSLGMVVHDNSWALIDYFWI